MSLLTWIALALCGITCGTCWFLVCDIKTLCLVITGKLSEKENQPRFSLLSKIVSQYRVLLTTGSHAASELRKSEELSRTKYNVLTTNVAAAVIIHEQNGTLMWVSPFTEVLTGFSTSEIMSHASTFFLANVHEDDREMVQRALGIISLGEPFHFKYRFFHKSGTLLWLETRLVPIFDDGLDDYVALSMTFDVTAAVNNQLYVEERNRDLQDFTYMISHDLKAPIFTIRGMLGIVEEDITPECPSSITEAITYITRATNRLETLVGGILELAKISAADRSQTSVDLHKVFEDIYQDYRHSLEECGGTLTFPSDHISVLGHPTHMYQVFSNLVNNAIKYRSNERSLEISFSILPARSTRRVQIVVSDNGRGIPEDKLPLLFKPFQRIGEENIEGTGVGLACVARLLEKSQGSIEAHSSPGKGTTFTVQLRRGIQYTQDKAESSSHSDDDVLGLLP